MHRTHRSIHAFTLIEAIGAIVLLSVAVPALFWAIRDAQTRRADPAALATAHWLAVERLETVIADRYAPSRGYAFVSASNYPDEAAVAGFPAFARSVTVTETGPNLSGPGAGFKTVRVRVTYAGTHNAARSVELAAVLTDF